MISLYSQEGATRSSGIFVMQTSVVGTVVDVAELDVIWYGDRRTLLVRELRAFPPPLPPLDGALAFSKMAAAPSDWRSSRALICSISSCSSLASTFLQTHRFGKWITIHCGQAANSRIKSFLMMCTPSVTWHMPRVIPQWRKLMHSGKAHDAVAGS